jgi:dihydrofolate reductase
MHPIIYDVAVSLDGFISGASGDISKFAHDGPVVEDYVTRLSAYQMVLMGRSTYEFGYDYGLKLGQNPYPHMKTIVYSQTLQCPEVADIWVRPRPSVSEIKELAQDAPGPIYLCGGGEFAGWMLENGLIDKIVLKRAPCLLGEGVRLFGNSRYTAALIRTESKSYSNGYLLETFTVQ